MPRIKRDAEVLQQEVLLLKDKMDTLKIDIAKVRFMKVSWDKFYLFVFFTIEFILYSDWIRHREFYGNFRTYRSN